VGVGRRQVPAVGPGEGPDPGQGRQVCRGVVLRLPAHHRVDHPGSAGEGRTGGDQSGKATENPEPKPRKGTRNDPRTVPAGPTATGDVRSYHPAFPAIGPDGRTVPTKSPWVRDGYQSSTNNSPKQILAGGDLHVLTASGHGPDGRPLPPFARRFRFLPAGENKGRPVVDAVLGAVTDGVTVTDLQADRGMTTLDPENFARPLHQTGVNVHKDLHPQQRGFQGFHNGALMLDGWFFSAAMPKHLWEVPGTTLNSTRAEREAIHRAHDKRLREWGYLSLGPVQADGSQRLQDPARRGTKRYPTTARQCGSTPASTTRPAAPPARTAAAAGPSPSPATSRNGCGSRTSG